MKNRDSIGFRLITAVGVTACIALALLTLFTTSRLHKGLREQSDDLGKLSENLLNERFHGEAHLARDILNKLETDFQQQSRVAAQNSQVIKAVQSLNEITIIEGLKNATKGSEIDFSFVVGETGLVIGASKTVNLLNLSSLVSQQDFLKDLGTIIKDNSRSKPKTFGAFIQFDPLFVKSMNTLSSGAFTPKSSDYGFVSISPVFDDFGETIGGIIAFRMLKSEELALQHFGKLAHTDVLLISQDKIISRTDAQKITNLKLNRFHPEGERQSNYIFLKSNEEPFVGYCASYKTIELCLANSVAELSKLQDNMLTIGAEQTNILQYVLFVIAAFIMALLTGVLFIAVKHSMRGLSELSLAANSVAGGNLSVPFEPKGVGEIKELSIAFDRMLINLRSQSAKVNQLAYFDAITGLPNREKLLEDTRHLFAPPLVAEEKNILMVIDLERMKLINDNFGLKAGDYVLKKTSDRISHIFKFFQKYAKISSYFITRSSGDNFIVAFTTRCSQEELGKIGDIIASTLSDPLRFGSSHIIIGAKMGLAYFGKDGKNLEEIVAHALLAIDSIRAKNAQNYAFYDESMALASLERAELESDLRRALQEKTLCVYYQPKVNCDDGKITGAEALVRWIHPTRNFVSPAKFIPIAEEAGLIGELGRFVLERSLIETKAMLDSGYSIDVSVNVSALQLEDPNFPQDVLELVEKYKFPFNKLELEITESMAMSDPKGVKERISVLRDKGIRFSMDDFGTGYSNLSQLGQLPIDILKLDRSLIMKVDRDTKKQALARSILSLSKEFGFITVVEGVEDNGELEFCIQNQATMVQGFVFSGAVPMNKFKEFFVGVPPHRSHFHEKFMAVGGTRKIRSLSPLMKIVSPKIDEDMSNDIVFN